MIRIPAIAKCDNCTNETSTYVEVVSKVTDRAYSALVGRESAITKPEVTHIHIPDGWEVRVDLYKSTLLCPSCREMKQ